MPGPRDAAPPSRSLPATLARRRVALGAPLVATASALALSGCWIDPDPDPVTRPADPDDAGTGASDLETVRTVVGQIDEVRARIAALAPLDEAIAALLAIHTAHRTVLADALGTEEAVDPVPADVPGSGKRPSPVATRELRRAEARLQTRLTDATLAVSSGELARALASATAGVVQATSLLDHGTAR